MLENDPSQFYSGLVADLYEPLAGDMADPDPIKRFVLKYGSPALELACGAGHPMLDLIADGLEVHGLDSSQDMLDLCTSKARELGLEVTLFPQRMQDLELSRRYQSCYVASHSFCLLVNPVDAQRTLNAVFNHLRPGGAFLISAFRPTLEAQPSVRKTKTREDGSIISVQSISQQQDLKEQLTKTVLRYELEQQGVVVDSVDREWILRWYTAQQLREMLIIAGFEIARTAGSNGEPASPESFDFSIIARTAAGTTC